MSWDRIEDNWKEYREHIKQQWDKLSVDELDEIGGQRDLLTAKIQEVYGVTAEEAERQVQEWESNMWTGA